jgi:hypothetical protein
MLSNDNPPNSHSSLCLPHSEYAFFFGSSDIRLSIMVSDLLLALAEVGLFAPVLGVPGNLRLLSVNPADLGVSRVVDLAAVTCCGVDGEGSGLLLTR